MCSNIPTPEETANLRLLRRLVVVLMVVMIAGFLLLMVLFAMRFHALSSAHIPLSDAPFLPKGTKALAVTYAKDFVMVLTEEQEILIFDPKKLTLLKRIDIGDITP